MQGGAQSYPFIEVSDLRSSLPTKSDQELQDWIDDALALAEQIAPCISRPEFPHGAAIKALLRAAIRYNAGGADGAVTQISAGPWQKSVDTRATTSGIMFSPAQKEQLRAMCRPKISEAAAYSVTFGMPGL